MIRVLRPTRKGSLISGRVFDEALSRNLYPAVSVQELPIADLLQSIFIAGRILPNRKAAHRAFRSATAGFDFICPNYGAFPATPTLIYVRNRSNAAVRFLIIAHSPGAYALEWALLRPLLRPGDLIIAPTESARKAIEFLCPEVAAFTFVVGHPIRPPRRIRSCERHYVASIGRVHPSKLVHRQIEAIAILRDRGFAVAMRIAGPLCDPETSDVSSYARSLQAKISRLNLDTSVHLAGEISGHAAKSHFLAGARLLVNLSVTIEESFGKSIVEALGAGIPVVGTSWNGFPETIGSAGRYVPVESTLMGPDVSAERVADAVQALLEQPISESLCRRQALRFHPRRIRRLYRARLEQALACRAAPGSQPEIPDPREPAAPRDGLLAHTAPLAQYSWRELFHLHTRDVTRLLDSGSSSHVRKSEADELQSLLILGVQAPLSRHLAGLEQNGMQRPVGREMAARERGFLARVAAGSIGPATLSSRLACMCLIAQRPNSHLLRRVLSSAYADGLRSWALDYLEIEALRSEGQFERACHMSLSREDPLYWGELAADRLRQLAMICREWGRPELALPRLRDWVRRFPDSSQSGGVQLDLSLNASAAGVAFLSESRQAIEAARTLLGNCAYLKGIDESLFRLENLLESSGWKSIEAQTGMIWQAGAIGRSSFRISTATAKFVLKPISEVDRWSRCVNVLRSLAASDGPFCPELVTTLQLDDGCRYALFRWIEGSPVLPLQVGDPGWNLVLELLAAVADWRIIPEWRIDNIWLERLRLSLSDDPAASFIMNSLCGRPPRGTATLAHGDFGFQNLLQTENGMVLIDWEEMGSAAPGFDAGWMLAVTGLQAGAQTRAELFRRLLDTGIPVDNLRWFERLGLLRLLYRVRTLPLDSDARRQVQSRVGRAVQQCAVRMGWPPHGQIAARMRGSQGAALS